MISDEEHQWHLAIDNDPTILRIYADWLMERGNPIGYAIAELDKLSIHQHESQTKNVSEWFDRRYNNVWSGEDYRPLDHSKEKELDELIDKYDTEFTNFPVTTDIRFRWELMNRRRKSTPGMAHIYLKCYVYSFAISRHLQGPHMHIVMHKRGSELKQEKWSVTSKQLNLPKVEFHGFNSLGVSNLLIPLPGLKVNDIIPPIELGLRKPGLFNTRTYKFVNKFGITPQIPISMDPRKGYKSIEISNMHVPDLDNEHLSTDAAAILEMIMTAHISSKLVPDNIQDV